MWKQEKKKILIALDPDIYKKLVKFAGEQKRSIVNSIVYLIEQKLNETNHQTTDSTLPSSK